MTMHSTIDKNKALFLSIGSVAIVLVVHLLVVHFQIVFFQYPLEYRENTDLWRTFLLSQGKNPYDYQNLPSGSSLYGYVYPWLAAKLFAITGVAFYPLRLIAFLVILPMIAIFVWQGVRQQMEWLVLFLLGSIVYATHLIHAGNFLAMPNTLGATLFCVAVLIPPLLHFSTISLLLACVGSVLGFFAKIYFGAGAFYILAYLLFNKDWRRAGVMLSFMLIAILASVFIVTYRLPAFSELNLQSTATIVKWDPHLVWPQFRDFIRIFFGPTVLLFGVRWLCPQAKIYSLKNPYVFGLLISTILLIRMGGNDGQYFLYFQQLLLPFVIPLCFEIIKASNYRRFIAMILFLNFLYLYSLGANSADLEPIKASFETVEKETAVLDSKASVLYNAPLSYYAIKQGVTPNEHGQSGGLLYTHGKGHEQYLRQDELIKENIRTAKYSEIFTDEWQQPTDIYHHDLIAKCYYKAREFEIVMWRQRNKTSLWLPKTQCPS